MFFTQFDIAAAIDEVSARSESGYLQYTKRELAVNRGYLQSTTQAFAANRLHLPVMRRALSRETTEKKAAVSMSYIINTAAL